MARILIVEDHEVHAELFARFVERLGHESVRHDRCTDPVLLDIELVLLEPAAGGAMAIVRDLRSRRSSLPIVCMSIYPQTPEVRALEPTAYLIKPFEFVTLGQVMGAALQAERPSAPGDPRSRGVSAA